MSGEDNLAEEYREAQRENRRRLEELIETGGMEGIMAILKRNGYELDDVEASQFTPEETNMDGYLERAVTKAEEDIEFCVQQSHKPITEIGPGNSRSERPPREEELDDINRSLAGAAENWSRVRAARGRFAEGDSEPAREYVRQLQDSGFDYLSHLMRRKFGSKIFSGGSGSKIPFDDDDAEDILTCARACLERRRLLEEPREKE